jgi:Fe2+ transport system protein FeoA
VGAKAHVHTADVDAATARYLCAIGLTGHCAFRLCKAGEPCIIQVRSTRIGLSKHVASRILVVPDHATP